MNSHLDILNELVQYADHAEPYCSTATRAPSTLFCCLHKLFTMKLTEKQVCEAVPDARYTRSQMVSFVDCRKSPYPRCCGFLYLRFVLPSDDVGLPLCFLSDIRSCGIGLSLISWTTNLSWLA